MAGSFLFLWQRIIVDHSAFSNLSSVYRVYANTRHRGENFKLGYTQARVLD